MKADRKFELVLYPDSTTYTCDEVILKAQKYFDFWAYCLHDHDIHEDGTPKKAHYHFYGKKYTTMTPAGVCYQLGLRENDIANCHNWKSSIRYLIHLDNPNKYQYDPSCITANFDLTAILNSGQDDDYQAKRIYEYIVQHPDYDLRMILDWVLDNNLWSGFRRGFAVWDKFIGIGGNNNDCSRNPSSRHGS